MFKLFEEDEIKKSILKCDYKRYSPSGVSTINTPNFHMYINIPRDDSVNSVLNFFLIYIMT